MPSHFWTSSKKIASIGIFFDYTKFSSAFPKQIKMINELFFFYCEIGWDDAGAVGKIGEFENTNVKDGDNGDKGC